MLERVRVARLAQELEQRVGGRDERLDLDLGETVRRGTRAREEEQRLALAAAPGRRAVRARIAVQARAQLESERVCPAREREELRARREAQRSGRRRLGRH